MACPNLVSDPQAAGVWATGPVKTQAEKGDCMPHPQTSADALDKANELIHEMYGDLFIDLAKV